MTLKELVMSVNFDDLLPYLKEHKKGHLSNIYAFREAYDRLRNMEPSENHHEEAYVESFEDGFRVYHLDNACWESQLAKELVISEDTHCTIEKVAMMCLWEITFYGFSPEEIKKRFNVHKIPKNKYEIALDKLEESIWKHQNSRKYRRRSPEGERCIAILRTDNVRSMLKRIRINMNRSKKKRRYRQKLRKSYLAKMGRRESWIRELTSTGSEFSRNDLGFLLNIDHGTQYTYSSITNENEKRLAYISESMVKYQQLDLSKYNNAVIGICISTKYPLAKNELEDFKTSIRSHLRYDTILFGELKQEKESREVEVILLLNQGGYQNL